MRLLYCKNHSFCFIAICWVLCGLHFESNAQSATDTLQNKLRTFLTHPDLQDDSMSIPFRGEELNDKHSNAPTATDPTVKEGTKHVVTVRAPSTTTTVRAADKLDNAVAKAIEEYTAKQAENTSIPATDEVPLSDTNPVADTKPDKGDKADKTDNTALPIMGTADSLQRIRARQYLELAKAAMMEDAYRDCVKELNNAQKADPGFKESYNMEAELWSALGFPEKAIDNYLIYLAIDSTDSRVYYNLAQCYNRIFAEDKALMALNLSIATKPDNFAAYYSRGMIMEKLNRPDLAYADYSQSILLNKYYLPAILNRAVLKTQLNQSGSAVEDLNFYLEFEPDNPIAIYYRGIAQLHTNHFTEACNDLNRAYQMGYNTAMKEIKLFCKP